MVRLGYGFGEEQGTDRWARGVGGRREGEGVLRARAWPLGRERAGLLATRGWAETGCGAGWASAWFSQGLLPFLLFFIFCFLFFLFLLCFLKSF